MPLRNGTPVRHVPSGVVDAVDGTNAPAGAMTALTNLIPDTATRGVYVPRPAAVLAGDFVASGLFASSGFISSQIVIGDLVYGTIATSRNAGKDEPFVYNLATKSFVVVAGVTAGNVPASPPTSGDWTPPIVAQVGSRIVVTHPGFPGGAVKIGWFDISSAKFSPSGSTVSGTRYITGNPAILGLQPGLLVTGAGIPAATTITKTFPGYICFDVVGNTHATTTLDGITVPAVEPGLVGTAAASGILSIVGPGIQPGTTITGVGAVFHGALSSLGLSLPTTTIVNGGTFTVFGDYSGSLGVLTGDTHSNTTIDNLQAMAGLTVGQPISGTGIPTGTTIATVNFAGSSITLSQAATATATQIHLSILGAAIQLSANTTATADSVVFAIAGGSMAAPLWGAGDTDRNALVSVPVGVAQFNGRAYYAMGTNGIQYSDSLFPCRISNSIAVQALTTNDGLAVTAIGPLLLSSPITGGIVQAIVAFQGATKMQQITGDQALPATSTAISAGGSSTLAMNAMPVATGTLAPLSITPSSLGLAFMSPQGLRFIKFDGGVSEPIGEAGKGIVVPFINASVPSRICAAAGDDILRISVQNGALAGSPLQEWWFALTRREWSGPHTSAMSLIQLWRSSFIGVLSGVNAMLWQSDAHQGPPNTITIENGAPLICTAQTTLLPDTGGLTMTSIVDASLACAISADNPMTVTALNPDGSVIDQITLAAPSVWGGFNWGAGLWGPVTFKQRALHWNIPLVMKQCSFQFSSPAGLGLRIGNLYMRYQRLNYNIEEAA